MRSLAKAQTARSGNNVVAAGDADQLADPSNAGDERLVPFFEVHAWMAGQKRSRLPHPLDMVSSSSA